MSGAITTSEFTGEDNGQPGSSPAVQQFSPDADDAFLLEFEAQDDQDDWVFDEALSVENAEASSQNSTPRSGAEAPRKQPMTAQLASKLRRSAGNAASLGRANFTCLGDAAKSVLVAETQALVKDAQELAVGIREGAQLTAQDTMDLNKKLVSSTKSGLRGLLGAVRRPNSSSSSSCNAAASGAEPEESTSGAEGDTCAASPGAGPPQPPARPSPPQNPLLALGQALSPPQNPLHRLSESETTAKNPLDLFMVKEVDSDSDDDTPTATAAATPTVNSPNGTATTTASSPERTEGHTPATVAQRLKGLIGFRSRSDSKASASPGRQAAEVMQRESPPECCRTQRFWSLPSTLANRVELVELGTSIVNISYPMEGAAQPGPCSGLSLVAAQPGSCSGLSWVQIPDAPSPQSRSKKADSPSTQAAAAASGGRSSLGSKVAQAAQRTQQTGKSSFSDLFQQARGIGGNLAAVATRGHKARAGSGSSNGEDAIFAIGADVFSDDELVSDVASEAKNTRVKEEPDEEEQAAEEAL